VGESVGTAPSGIPVDLPDVPSLTRHGGSAVWRGFFSLTHVSSISKTVNKPELLEHFLTGDSSKDSKGALVKGNPYAQRLRKGQSSRIRAYPGPVRPSLPGRNTFPLVAKDLRILRC